MPPLNPHRAAEPQDSERTLATVLFTDIVGSTQRAVELGDRRWRELLERHEGVVTREIEGFGGRIVDTAGDGVFAVFAAPAQAVRCAGAICRSVRTLGLEVRTGVHTGECEVRGERLAGLAVHIGARIGALAGPGQVLVSHTVRDLVLGSEIRFAERGPHALKGIPGEWRLFEACDETEAADGGPDTTGADVAEEEGPLPLPASVEAPKLGSLLGRHSHVALLEQHLDTARAGSRRFVFLAGEPGIGKTRLAEEFARRAHAGGATVLHGRCFEEALVSYEPMITALRQYVTTCPARVLREQVGRAGPDLARLVPELRDRLPDLPQPVSADPEGERFRLFEAIRELLTRASATTPLVLVVDDMHWADKPTMLVLRHLARSPEQSKLLVLGTYRDPDPAAQYVAEFLAELRRERRGERIALSGLDERDVASLVSDQSGHRPLEAVVRRLHEQTDGNPFFLEELVRHLTEAGMLKTAEQDAALDAAGIPDVVSDVIARRVARLSDAARETLAVASVAGRDFALDLVDRVTDLGEEQTIEAIEDALRAGIVVEVAAVPDSYSFTHALIRDTLYRGIKTSRRLRLHRRVAEALEELCGDDPRDRLAEIAHHFSEGVVAGEGAAKAIEYLERAAVRAMHGLAYEEAAGHYARALGTLERAPGAGHDRETTPCRLNEGLGEALSITGRHAEATAAFSQALDHVPVEEPLTRARLLRKMSHSLETQRRYGEAMSASLAAEQALNAIRAEPDGERELLQAWLDRMPLHYWQGQVEEMVALLDKAGPLVDRIGTPTQRAAFSTGLLLMVLRRDRYAIPDDTLAIARTAAEAADESGDVNVMGMPRFNLGFCHLWRGELDEAEEHIREAVVLAERTGNMTVKSRALVYLTIVYRRRGDVDAVDRLAGETLEVSEAGDMLEYVATSRANQAWVHWKRGDLDAAAEAAGTALRGWDALPTSFAYAFKWTALWPLMAVSLARNEPDEAAACARWLLDPTHQVLPEEVAALLERAEADGACAGRALEAAARLGID